MDLFEANADNIKKRLAPLADRMRPARLDELLGQSGLWEHGPLRLMIESGKMFSVILYGPAGVGKTSLARLLAAKMDYFFEQRSAVDWSSADIRRFARQSIERLGMHGQNTILFLDEVHRLNRAQQDVLLPWLEDGTFSLIGATTENPLYVLQPALVSRVLICRMNPLSDEVLRQIVERALTDKERGLAGYRPIVGADAVEELIRRSGGGDARRLLNGLQLAVTTAPPADDGARQVTHAHMRQVLQQSGMVYDRSGDAHYDTISAFIKSIRGSDPDAAVHYLARMLHAGEDPLFIARRLVIAAAEDIGLADPQALVLANAAMSAVRHIGMPECRIPLAEATLYLSLAPKSNASYRAIQNAMADVERGLFGSVPGHLRDRSRRKPGRDQQEYLYPHDHSGHWVDQQYLPEVLNGKRYYQNQDPSLAGEAGQAGFTDGQGPVP